MMVTVYVKVGKPPEEEDKEQESDEESVSLLKPVW